MPTFSVMLGRRTIRIHDINKPVIQVGRDPGMDIVIDNPSISRRQVEIRQEGGGWVVEDLGSANGTLLGDERITAPRRIEPGDEIGMGKFSIIFDKVVGEESAGAVAQSVNEASGTMTMSAKELQAILASTKGQRQAHLLWESGGQQGTYHFSSGPAVLFGTNDLCDVRVPKGPKHHVLVVKSDRGVEIRDLAAWSRMRVGGAATKRASLKDGDVVEVRGLKLTFVGDFP